MPFINLIAEQRLEARKAEQRTRIAFIGFAATASTAVCGFGFLLFMTQLARSEVVRLKGEIHRLEPIRNEIAANQAQFRELSPRLNTLEDAQSATSRWSRILQHVADNTPSTMWLTHLRTSVTDPTKPIQASFQGVSAHLEPVGEFILRLQNSHDLQLVNLKFAQEKVVDNSKGIEFEVTADVAGTAQKPSKKPGEDSSA